MRSIHSVADLFEIVNGLYNILDGNFDFDADGWPIFKREHFLDAWPDDVITYTNRNSRLVLSKASTLLCHFDKDRNNYKRLSNIESDIAEYRKFIGTVFLDITITKDMDVEMQAMTMLANQLYAAVLAYNNIKLVFNTRCGLISTQDFFRHIPRNITCASGFLGCDAASNMFEVSEYINKILKIMPKRLIIYGKQDLLINEQLDTLGINYRYYEDFHRRSKERIK